MATEDQDWDMVKVFERVVEATRVVRMLPQVTGRGRATYWPDFVRSYWEAYAYTEAEAPRPRPTAEELDRLDETILWLAWLRGAGDEYPKVVWARADRHPWRRIAAKTGLSHQTCMHRFRDGVALMMYALKEGRLEARLRRGKGLKHTETFHD